MTLYLIDTMPALAAATVLAGVLMPMLVAVLTRPGMRAIVKQVILWSVCLVAGVVIAVLKGSIPGIPQNVIGYLSTALVTAAAVASISQGIYRSLYGAVKAVESATSPGGPGAGSSGSGGKPAENGSEFTTTQSPQGFVSRVRAWAASTSTRVAALCLGAVLGLVGIAVDVSTATAAAPQVVVGGRTHGPDDGAGPDYSKPCHSVATCIAHG